MNQCKYTIRRSDGDHRYDISANTLDELRDLRNEQNKRFLSHGYGCIASYYDKRSKQYRYIDILSGEECSHDGKYVYEEFNTAMWLMSNDSLYDGEPLEYEEKFDVHQIKTGTPYPPYVVHRVNKIWRDTIKRALKELKNNKSN